MGKDIERFVKQAGKKLSCRHINRMYYDVKDAVCCGILNGLFLGWELGINCSVDDLLCMPSWWKATNGLSLTKKVKEWHVKMRKKYDEEYEDSEDDEDDEEQGGGGAGDIEMKGNPMGYTNVKRWSD